MHIVNIFSVPTKGGVLAAASRPDWEWDSCRRFVKHLRWGSFNKHVCTRLMIH